MKKDIHPTNYRPVVFQDVNNDSAFLTRSTAQTEETIKWEDGNEYPLVKIHISSASHPFYTGEEKIVDVEGRVDRFKSRQAVAQRQRDAVAKHAKKEVRRQAKKTERDESKSVKKSKSSKIAKQQNDK